MHATPPISMIIINVRLAFRWLSRSTTAIAIYSRETSVDTGPSHPTQWILIDSTLMRARPDIKWSKKNGELINFM